MASVMRFDEWQNTLGTSSITVDSSGNVSVPKLKTPGGIIQVVQGERNTTLTLSGLVQNTFYDIGLSAVITPKYSTSKILITYSVQGSAQYDSILRIVRDSTVVGAPAGGNSSGTSFFGPRGNTYEGYSNTGSYLDSPATTSALTYKIQLTAGGLAYINRSTDSDTSERTISTITLMEVAQ